MAFRKKADSILALRPDILVVPECEHPNKLLLHHKRRPPTTTLWFGHNQHKGLGIFSYADVKFRVLRNYNEQFRTVIPVKVFNDRMQFLLFAVWANNPTDRDGQYVTQVWKAIHHYEKQLKTSASILIGDFNSNTIWDRPRREGNHSSVVKKLEQHGIYSTYHTHFNQVQGKEQHPTLYMYRHKNKPYHIDYCFASKMFIDNLESVEVGSFQRWKKYSDHVPLIVTFKSDQSAPVQMLPAGNRSTPDQ